MKKNKNTVLYTDNESMLVSERKLNSENVNTDAGNNHASCNCQKRLNVIETKLEMLSLTLDQMTSHINISYTKHMESYGKLAEQKKHRENLQHKLWSLQQDNKSYYQRYSNQALKNQREMEKLNEQVEGWTNMLREMKNWKNSQNSLSIEVEKQFTKIMEQHQGQTDEKLKKMLTAIQQVSILQRKMLMKGDNCGASEKIGRTHSIKGRQSLGGRKHSGYNESTIAGSHFYKI